MNEYLNEYLRLGDVCVEETLFLSQTGKSPKPEALSQRLVNITAHIAHFYGQLVIFVYFLCIYQRYT